MHVPGCFNPRHIFSHPDFKLFHSIPIPTVQAWSYIDDTFIAIIKLSRLTHAESTHVARISRHSMYVYSTSTVRYTCTIYYIATGIEHYVQHSDQV